MGEQHTAPAPRQTYLSVARCSAVLFRSSCALADAPRAISTCATSVAPLSATNNQGQRAVATAVAPQPQAFDKSDRRAGCCRCFKECNTTKRSSPVSSKVERRGIAGCARVRLRSCCTRPRAADTHISDTRMVCIGPSITHTSIYGFLGVRYASDDGIC